jgi:SAM-dependent methyltransferase
MKAMSKIVEYYQSTQVEATRLSEGCGLLEKWRTLDILQRFLPPAPAVIADVGGAEGVYAFPLADRGYEVHLIDITPAHIEKAHAINNTKNTLKSIKLGSAAELHLPDESVDAVLLFGPLYHLQDYRQRCDAIAEAHRVLRKGGMLFAAGISRFAGLLDGVARKMLKDENFYNIISKTIETGTHTNITNNPAYFTDAHLHRPDELAFELAVSGFHELRVLGIEGAIWTLPEQTLNDFLSHEDAKEKLFTLLRKTEAEPSMLGASAHIMAMGTK